jgi:hypothetical protein
MGLLMIKQTKQNLNVESMPKGILFFLIFHPSESKKSSKAVEQTNIFIELHLHDGIEYFGQSIFRPHCISEELRTKPLIQILQVFVLYTTSSATNGGKTPNKREKHGWHKYGNLLKQ